MNAIVIRSIDIVKSKGYISESIFKIYDETLNIFVDINEDAGIRKAAEALISYHVANPKNIVTLYKFDITANKSVFGTYN
jgi:hypothetical protein